MTDNKKEKNNFISKPPVVVVLGHVDHGKTSLLLAIRKLNVPLEKPGGVITQHIGAYQAEKDGKKITFIDTPGHEAFSAMRSRGAKVADIAILAVDAAEGIKAQTKEAISHIKNSNIPMIVAINKIDKPDADPQRAKRELMKEDILVESMGGKVPSVNVSAKTGKGIEDLLDMILIVAEMEDLKVDAKKHGQGLVIESYLDSKRGPIATLILSEGRLSTGEIIGTSSVFGKVRGMEDFQGSSISRAMPSQPAIVLGLESVPLVGDQFNVFSSIEKAKAALKEDKKDRLKAVSTEPGQKVLNLVLKADVLGSLEAIEEILKTLPQDKIVLNVLKSEVGSVTETDIKTAIRAKAKILAFRVKINPVARSLAEREKINVMNFEVIYDLVESVRKYMERFLDPEIQKIELGKIRVLEVFMAEKNRQVIGGRVASGEIKKGSLFEVQRQTEVIGRGKLVNLQRNKKDTDRVVKGDECGILYEGSGKIEKEDFLVAYIEEKKRGQL